jgi:hypothetical protein
MVAELTNIKDTIKISRFIMHSFFNFSHRPQLSIATFFEIPSLLQTIFIFILDLLRKVPGKCSPGWAMKSRDPSAGARVQGL